jgi:hypothetical protein
MAGMDKTEIRKLPPMSALEFAIQKSFSNFFFGLRLLLGWAILQVPVLAAIYYGLLGASLPDFQKPAPAVIAAAVIVGLFNLLASLSISVNWHRRILLGETPSGLRWWRLDGLVWRYLARFVIIGVILAVIFGLAGAAFQFASVESAPGPVAKMAGTVVAALLGLFALFAWYRLSTALPALAAGNADYGIGSAWRATRRNSLRFLGFTFWLLFALAIGNGLTAGAVMAQQMMPNAWIVAGAAVFATAMSLLTALVSTSIATSHYYFFGEGKDYPET